jgi:hypothetical protein
MIGLLRARRERPSCGRAAEQRDEVAPFHCPVSPVLPTERIAHLGQAGGAALRDFDPAYVGFGVKLRPPVDRPYVGLRWLRT